MQKKFGIIGGDLRLIFLSLLLAKENNIVYTYALEKAEILKKEENVKVCASIQEIVNKSDVLIGAIPFSKNNIEINSAYSDKKVTIQDLIENLQNKKIIAGSISKKILKQAQENNVEMIDIMDNEKLTILNTIATAEGAIEKIISNTNTILHGSQVLILGYGRVSKTLAKKLKGLDAKITIAARKKEAFAQIYTNGFEAININNMGENLKKYSIIINTVPELILGKEQLKYVDNETFLLDLASMPGGIDFEEANRRKIKSELALGLPGKCAPLSTAMFIKDVIEEISI